MISQPLTRGAAQKMARQLSWEPPGHLGMPGQIPDNRWDAWRAFEPWAMAEINWSRIDASVWRANFPSGEVVPDYEAVVAGEQLLLVQHVYHGFPDPPEWALYERRSNGAKCLGCFGQWPAGWEATEAP